MTAEPTLESVFRKRSEQTADELPCFSLICAAVADDPRLAACLDELPVDWTLADRFTTAVSHVLRTRLPGHPLAAYFPTLGGSAQPGPGLVAVLAEFVAEHHDALIESVARGNARWNDPARVAHFWPALTHVAARDDRPLSLVELGGAAGLTAQPDRYGYRFGDRLINGDRPLVLDLELRGVAPADLDHPVDIAGRTVIDLDPLHLTDPETVAWMRASVRPDLDDSLRRLDLAIAEADGVSIDWRVGDLVDLLPAALAEIPTGHLPVVYGSAVLCCLYERRSHFARALAAAGRDLVWLALEAPANSLSLVSDDPLGEVKDKFHLLSVTYREGRPVAAELLAESDPWGRWLDWNPRPVPLRD
ncbi:DUF2332 domain-containing protein [Phytomonospora sp. NPDC050363]|uniref:DUF2332 domain-containing protein n=1 Tax=Phytomonospora sp. NPDC050363 TaxID=3155642 RepID=UPI0033E0528A